MRRRFSSQFLGMNSTVVYRDGAAHVIDPGVFPWELERMREFLQQQALHQVQILFTHTHGDHISGWYAFRNFPAYGHESIALKNPTVRHNDVRYIRGVYRKQRIPDLDQLQFPEPIHLLADGEVLEHPPFSVVFYHVPGHAIDQSVIVVPEEHLMFSGDMLIQSPVPFVLHSMWQYRASLDRIRFLVKQYQVACLIPGHGKPARDQGEILERIQRESDYLDRLTDLGIQLYRQGLRGDDLREQLYALEPRFTQLQPHQTNVQSFLREISRWLGEEEEQEM